jgi:hypothetical protein
VKYYWHWWFGLSFIVCLVGVICGTTLLMKTPIIGTGMIIPYSILGILNLNELRKLL